MTDASSPARPARADRVGIALFVGPHPDDVELFAGGTAARLSRLGHRVVLCDLTRGERATNGTPEQRAAEATAAAAALRVSERRNLCLPDAGLCADDDEQVLALVDCLRDVRPDVVFSPPRRARHPDHEQAGDLVHRAVFLSGLRSVDRADPPHRPEWVLRYAMRVEQRPDLLVPLEPADVEAKYDAISAHASQTGSDATRATLVAQAGFRSALEARDRTLGAHAGVDAAEGFTSERAVVIDDPVAWALSHPSTAVHWLLGGGR